MQHNLGVISQTLLTDCVVSLSEFLADTIKTVELSDSTFSAVVYL